MIQVKDLVRITKKESKLYNLIVEVDDVLDLGLGDEVIRIFVDTNKPKPNQITLAIMTGEVFTQFEYERIFTT